MKIAFLAKPLRPLRLKIEPQSTQSKRKERKEEIKIT
jgi:hypothetical protein